MNEAKPERQETTGKIKIRFGDILEVGGVGIEPGRKVLAVTLGDGGFEGIRYDPERVGGRDFYFMPGTYGSANTFEFVSYLGFEETIAYVKRAMGYDIDSAGWERLKKMFRIEASKQPITIRCQSR